MTNNTDLNCICLRDQENVTERKSEREGNSRYIMNEGLGIIS